MDGPDLPGQALGGTVLAGQQQVPGRCSRGHGTSYNGADHVAGADESDTHEGLLLVCDVRPSPYRGGVLGSATSGVPMGFRAPVRRSTRR